MDKLNNVKSLALKQNRYNARDLITHSAHLQRKFDNSTLRTQFKYQNKKVSKIQIPLDNFNQPFLINILPFYNRFNYFNYSVKLVDEIVNDENLDYELEQVTGRGYTHKTATDFVGIEAENRMINVKILKGNKQTKKNIPTNDDSILKSIKGINKEKFYLYKSDSNGKFACLNSNQKVSYDQLNDDFCDCIDGTDEPGTSACSFSSFYCSFQNEFLPDNFIPSSRVNDKICDCCDGSDESEEMNCPNKCESVVSDIKEKVKQKKMGFNLKKKYLLEGIFKNEKLYGPQGVFFKLSKSCFKIDWSEYTFEVCPFVKVIQYKRHHKDNVINLGNQPSLVLSEISNEKKWIIKMENGSPQNCGQPRQSEIVLSCGTDDSLIKVQEPEKCVYQFELITPASC